MKPKHILFGMLALFAASCANDEMNEVAALKQNGIQVTAGLTANTRVNFEQDGNVTHALWEEGDQITLYAPSQGYLPYQVSTLSEDAASAIFTPINDALQNTDETIYAAHRAGMEADIADGMATLPNTDTWTDEHPLPFAYAISKVADGKLNLSFEHVFAYLKLTLNAETVAGSTNKSIAVIGLSTTSDEPLSNIYGFFNIPEQEYVIEKGSNHMFFSLQEPFTATGTDEKSVYIPILPQSAGKTITINIFGDYEAADTLFTESKEVPSTGFVAGRAYTYSPKSSITRVGNTVTLTEASTLSKAISTTEKDTITSLKIIGPLNGDDIRFIREMAGRDVNGNETTGKLTYLDISEASIVAGGGYYFATENESFYTENSGIGGWMFYETIIENIQLPQNATLIGPSAFAYSSLKSITIPNGVTSIGGNAFVGCASLVNVTIPEGVTEIPASAFSSCTSLTSISIPSSVTEIAFRAFNGCSSLSSVIIGNGVTSIGDNAFEDCSYLASINLPDALTSIGSSAFHNCSSLASIYIPDAVATIGNGAFYGCTILKSVEFSSESSLTLIDELTFRECSSLISISIPDAVTEIASSAFYECSSLVSAIVGSGVTSIGDNAFYHCTSLESLNLPDALTSIGESAFSGCSALTSINIPDGVTSINKSTFNNCTSLTSVTIGNGVTSIGETAFFKCSSLTSINLPDALISIGSNAFTGSSKLESIIIPSGVTSLADAAFYYCSSLSEVTCEATNPPTLGSIAFFLVASPSTLIVPIGCTTAYGESDWAQYFTTIKGENDTNGSDGNVDNLPAEEW